MTPCRLPITVLAAATLLIPSFSFAAWAPNGNPLCTATGAQLAPSTASDGGGGMIVTWQDRRRGSGFNDIYATRVLGDGSIAPGWPVDGVVLTQSGIAGAPRAFPDGAGGALVLWLEPGGLYGQRITGGGALDPGFPANGKLVISSSAGFSGITPSMGFEAVTDGAGGAYVLGFLSTPNPFGGFPTQGALITRVGPDAVKPAAWTPNPWVGIGSSQLGLTAHLGTMPGGGCVFGVITRYDGPTNPSTAYAGRILPNGTQFSQFLPEYPTIPFPGNNPGPTDVSVVADGAGGHFAFKRDSDGWFTIFANHGHHVNNAWGETWPQASLVPFLHFPVSDGGLGAFLVGTTGSPLRLEVDYFSSTGAPGWPVGSVVLSQPTAFQNLLTTGLLGGAFTCWSENSGTGYDIRAALVSSAGTMTDGTGPGGGAVCNAAGSQLSPNFVLDGPGALAAWEDQRSETAGDIYANRIVLNLPTAVQVSLTAADVRSDAVRLRWSVIDPNGTGTVLRRTRTGEWTPIGSPEMAAGTMSFEDRGVTPGTEYGYALVFSGDPTARLGEHWVQVPGIAAALAGFVPNPSTGTPRIAFALRGGERAQLEVVDISGRVVMTRDVSGFGTGSHTVDLGGARLAAGMYVMRLTQGDRVHLARGVVVR